MNKIKQIKIPIEIENIQYNWKLIRERDKLTKQSEKILWLEFHENGTFKAKYNEPKIGYSLLMSPFNEFFTWQTTPIIDIIEQRKNYIKFQTENSTYELFKLIEDENI